MSNVVRIVQLVPQRAFGEQNDQQETQALFAAGYDVHTIVTPHPGVRGIVWLETIGVRKAIQAMPDIVSARDLDALGAAVKVKRRTGAKLVYDMHEVYSMMVEDDVPAAVARYADKREKRLLRDVDLALASDSGRAQWLVDQGYVYRPMHVILNCRDPVVPYVSMPHTRSLSYTGTLHPSRFIREMVEAMALLEDVELYIAGPRTPGSLYDWLARNQFKNVVFLGHVSPQGSLKVMQRADVSVQMANPMSRINVLGPYNRLFDAMAVGRPVIGTVGTANSDIAVGLKMGIASAYDMDSYKYAVRTILGKSREELMRMSTAAYGACTNTFNWKAEARKLVEAYGSLA